MMKTILNLCFVLLLSFVLISCTSPNENSTNEEPSPLPAINEETEDSTEPVNDSLDHGLPSAENQIEPHLAVEDEPFQRFRVDPKTYMIHPVDDTEDAKSSDKKYVLLTFDDTPTAKATSQILDTLDQYKAKALFFVNGHYAEPHLELLKEIKARGHLIGNHTWWHIYIRKESEEKVREEIVGLNDFLEKHLGERPKYFRPPFGQNSEVSLRILKEEGMQSMNWSNGSLDWELKDPKEITKQVLSNIKNGDNILFHDKQSTADALGNILKALQEEGYHFVLPTEVVLPEK